MATRITKGALASHNQGPGTNERSAILFLLFQLISRDFQTYLAVIHTKRRGCHCLLCIPIVLQMTLHMVYHEGRKLQFVPIDI